MKLSVRVGAQLLLSTIYVTENDGKTLSAKRRADISEQMLGIRRYYKGSIGRLEQQCPYRPRHFHGIGGDD